MVFHLDLQPMEHCVNYVTHEKSFNSCKKWSRASLNMVKTLLDIAYDIHVDLKNYDELEDVYYGQIYFRARKEDLRRRGMQAKHQPLSLSKILIKHNHAVEIERTESSVVSDKCQEELFGSCDSIDKLVSEMPDPPFSSTLQSNVELELPLKAAATSSVVEEVEVSPDFVNFLQLRKESKSPSATVKDLKPPVAMVTTTENEKMRFKPAVARILEKKRKLHSPSSAPAVAAMEFPKPTTMPSSKKLILNAKEEVFVHRDPAARTPKPIAKLADLPDLRVEYYHHLINSLEFSSPRHVIQKSKFYFM